MMRVARRHAMRGYLFGAEGRASLRVPRRSRER